MLRKEEGAPMDGGLLMVVVVVAHNPTSEDLG